MVATDVSFAGLSTRQIHLTLLAVQICFASLAVAGKAALGTIPPNAIVLWRVAGGALVFVLLSRSRGSARVEPGDWWKIPACAALGVAANQLLFVNGLVRSTATNASVLGATIPVFTAVVGMISGRERPRARVLVGIAVALSGTLLLVRIDRFSLSDGHVVGNLLIVANSLCYGTFLVFVRDLAPRYAPMTLVALLFLSATPLVLPFGAADAVAVATSLDASKVGFLAFLLAVPTVGAYALNQRALAHAEASLVAVYVYLQPILATAGAVLLLGERPGWREAAAGVVILVGVTIAARRR
jgi:drug/metabolite transporter (DMT)-like permease